MHSRLTSKSQTTIPKRIRDRLQLKPGDFVKYEVEDGRVILTKVSAIEMTHLAQLEKTLSEWDTPEDAAAYDGL
ncbi:MAG: AbrB/MazE/SpoVT family DNA-binding domain-containing protein [Rhodomicrobium sp.]|jgi:antitoxin PrlF